MQLAIMRLHLFLAAIHLTVSADGHQTHPGLVVRLNQNGIQYLQQELSLMCRDRIASIDWDNALKRILLSKFPLLEAKLIDLRLPEHYDIGISPAAGLYFTISKMDMAFMLEERFQILSLLRPGMAIVAGLKSISVAGTIDISSLDGEHNLSIQLRSCTVTIGRSRVKFLNADFVGNLVSNLNKTIHGVIEVGAESRICQHISSLLEEFDERLRHMPKKVPIATAFNKGSKAPNISQPTMMLQQSKKVLFQQMKFDISLIRPPFLHEKAIVTMHSGRISWKGYDWVPFNPKPMYSTLENNSKMASIFVSDYVFNSLLYSLWEKKFFDFVATKENTPLLDILQSAHCPFDLCLTDLLDLMGIIVDYDSFLELAANMTGPPRVTFANRIGMVSTTGRIALNEVDPDGTRNILKVFVETVAAFQLYLHDRNTVTGSVVIDRVVLRSDSTGRLQPTDKELELFASIAKTVLQVLGSEFLKQGVQIPTFNGVQVSKGVLQFIGNCMKMDFDFRLNRQLLRSSGLAFNNPERR